MLFFFLRVSSDIDVDYTLRLGWLFFLEIKMVLYSKSCHVGAAKKVKLFIHLQSHQSDGTEIIILLYYNELEASHPFYSPDLKGTMYLELMTEIIQNNHGGDLWQQETRI